MPRIIEGNLNAEGRKVAIVASRFNDFITARLIEGALDALTRHGVKDADVTICRVPGAFEIPQAARRLALSGNYDGVICLGAVWLVARIAYAFAYAHPAGRRGLPFLVAGLALVGLVLASLWGIAWRLVLA